MLASKTTSSLSSNVPSTGSKRLRKKNRKQALDANPKAIQQINFTANLDREVTMFLLLKKEKKPFQIFRKGLSEYYKFILL